MVEQKVKEELVDAFYKLEGIENTDENGEGMKEAIESLQERIEEEKVKTDGEEVCINASVKGIPPVNENTTTFYKTLSELTENQVDIFDGLEKSDARKYLLGKDLYNGIQEAMNEDRDFIFTMVASTNTRISTVSKEIDKFVEFVSKDGKYIVADKNIEFVEERMTIEFNVKLVVEEVEYREFVKGDYVTFFSPILNTEIFQITRKPKLKSRILYVYVRDSQGSSREMIAQWFRHATNEEIQAKTRLD